MKKISMKEVQRKFRCYQAGYCDLQVILATSYPEYYNAGVYGWNCDVYTFGEVAISTGYRNTKGERIPAELIERYERKARSTYDWRERKKIAADFVTEVAAI